MAASRIRLAASCFASHTLKGQRAPAGIQPCDAAVWIVVLVDYPVIAISQTGEDARLVFEHVIDHLAGPAVGEFCDHVCFGRLAVEIFGSLPAEGPQLVEIVSVRRADVCGGQPAQRIPPGAVEDVARVDLDAIEARPAEAGIIEIGFGVAAILREACAAEDYGCYGPRAIEAWLFSLSTRRGRIVARRLALSQDASRDFLGRELFVSVAELGAQFVDDLPAPDRLALPVVDEMLLPGTDDHARGRDAIGASGPGLNRVRAHRCKRYQMRGDRCGR
ncbi:MAG: hypothetical protein KatS3mg038_1741 [Candidatus Kapaibacterium sp.]|nr:MAG: hypothetical protein KatS3mg038_1741 [Candidatus Kapabacteria bacterium]